ncbi:hypothetical protein RHECNPAF_14110023 [Rhizobium etli CNPAF512]|nr:hypothetical protein RHECNPAF_14110023 [Rhizobium etli CNPAF512]
MRRRCRHFSGGQKPGAGGRDAPGFDSDRQPGRRSAARRAEAA